MGELEDLKKELEAIKARNARVEADKAWETSLYRKLAIVFLTYLVVVVFFYVAELPRPFINAIVPTLGFILSTLTLSFIKELWVRKYKK